MAAPVNAPLPLGVELYDGYTLRLTALSPTTGALVNGVTISGATIQADTPAASGALEAGPFFLVPGPAT